MKTSGILKLTGKVLFCILAMSHFLLGQNPVTTPGGTNNKYAKFTGSATIANANLSDYFQHIALGTTTANYTGWGGNSVVQTIIAGTDGVGDLEVGATTNAVDGAFLGGISFISTPNGVGSRDISTILATAAGTSPNLGGNLTFWTRTTGGAQSERMRITSTGNVGIGTTNTGTARLAVEGKIEAREVVVTSTSPFPDYVFDADYKVMPLGELEQSIIHNKHLPEIPSAKSIMKSGLKLGEMEVKLLKKVEELTLYVIAIQKQNESLKKRVSLLEK